MLCLWAMSIVSCTVSTPGLSLPAITWWIAAVFSLIACSMSSGVHPQLSSPTWMNLPPGTSMLLSYRRRRFDRWMIISFFMFSVWGRFRIFSGSFPAIAVADASTSALNAPLVIQPASAPQVFAMISPPRLMRSHMGAHSLLASCIAAIISGWRVEPPSLVKRNPAFTTRLTPSFEYMLMIIGYGFVVCG